MVYCFIFRVNKDINFLTQGILPLIFFNSAARSNDSISTCTAIVIRQDFLKYVARGDTAFSLL